MDQFLQVGEYFKEEHSKTTIYLHHTAGGHRPDWVINGWDVDDDVKTNKARIVATSFVIGGISTSDHDAKFDGMIYRAFEQKYWAHHLGTVQSNNAILNKQSIGIEICNYGPLRKGSGSAFYNYVNKPVPSDMVVELEKPFRGYKFWHAYTQRQLATIKLLITQLKSEFPTISLSSPLLKPEGFELNKSACVGMSGVYSHSNVRLDKFDLSPQPQLIEMLNSILTP